MATGDITSVTIRPDGWSADVVIEGFTTGGTYAFGLGTNNADTASSKFVMTVTSEGYDYAGTLTTRTRTVYGTAVVRVPATTATIAGSFTSGTFQDGEAVSQAVSGATAVIVGGQSAGATLRVRTVAGTPNTTGVWTGGTSSATFTPTATPVTLAANTPDELPNGGNVKVRVALSSYVYDDDKSGGAGTSGTDPSVTIAAGWATNTGGASQTSNAATALAVTNSSTVDYPVAFGQWDHIAGVCTADRVKANFNVAFNARHIYGVACVRFDADGRTSLANYNSTVVWETATQRSATSLYAVAHVATIPIAGFTQAELIDLRARVYPLIGDANSVLDTNSYTTATDEPLGYTKATITCDKSDLLDSIKYVSTTGNDTKGDGSSGNPYATIAKAYSVAGVNIVYLKAGTHQAVGSTITRRTTNEWIIVQPEPGESSSTVTVQFTDSTGGVRTYRCERLQYKNVTFTLENTSAYGDGEATGNYVRFVNCVFDSSGVAAPTTSPAYRCNCAYFHNCTGDLGYNTWSIRSFGTARLAHVLDGCILNEGATSSYTNSVFRMVACKGNTGWQQKPSANIAPSQNNMLCEFNYFHTLNNSNGELQFSFGSVEDMTNVSFLGNVFEKTFSGANGIMALFGDNVTNHCNHVIFWHNTLVGERINFGYNDAGTAAANRTNWSLRFNAFDDFNVKSDTFGTPHGARTGNWPIVYGVNFFGNRMETSAWNSSPPSFPPAFYGIDCAYTGSGTHTWTDDKSASTGNGTYTPTLSSPVLNRVTSGAEVCLFYDQQGYAIGSGSEGGALQLGNVYSLGTFSSASVPTAGTSIVLVFTDPGRGWRTATVGSEDAADRPGYDLTIPPPGVSQLGVAYSGVALNGTTLEATIPVGQVYQGDTVTVTALEGWITIGPNQTGAGSVTATNGSTVAYSAPGGGRRGLSIRLRGIGM